MIGNSCGSKQVDGAYKFGIDGEFFFFLDLLFSFGCVDCVIGGVFETVCC